MWNGCQGGVRLIIERIIIENYRLIRHADFRVNSDMNIFVGDNDSGKSTLLEVIAILTSGKLHGYAFDRQLKTNFFNDDVRRRYLISIKKHPIVDSLSKIIFEAYCDNSNDNARYAGTNNSLNENCPGIRIDVEFNLEYEQTYKMMLEKGEIFDIPVEFYAVRCRYFSGETVAFRFCPIKAAFIDTTRKDYSYVVDRFVSENITAYLSQQEQIDLSTAYRKNRHDFHTNDLVQKLNQSVKDNVLIGDRSLTIDLKEEEIDEWKRQMSVVVDNTPFENVGFGSQNTIKVELAIKNSTEQVNLVLMEEPENNLSYSNMAKLIQRILESQGKQIFISTHSSYVANKLDLGKLLLVRSGMVFAFGDLSDNTINYFKKLPGYDTLRLVLADRIILVEGPTEELVIQRAYLDKYGRLPSADGIDIVTVNSLAFKRYCDIAILMKKPISVVTDNDGDIEVHITKKYEGYIGNKFLNFFYERDEHLNSIEQSVLAVNLVDGVPTKQFLEAISKNKLMREKDVDQVRSFMINNKVEWALRVFDSSEKIQYPEYVKNVIKKYH
jgi:putative ATP-dependent endonuclease of OLD family